MDGDREARERGEAAYYRLPRVAWTEVDPEAVAELRRLHNLIGAALDEASRELGLPQAAVGRGAEAAPSPAQLAYRLAEGANRLWAQAAGTEQDLRQVITTLRTALAVCWDLYTPRQAEHTSVSAHMAQLRTRIEDFERDLGELLTEGEGSTEGRSPRE